MIESTTPSPMLKQTCVRTKQPKSYRVEVLAEERWVEVFEYVRHDAALKCAQRVHGLYEAARIVRIRDGKVRTFGGHWE